MIFVHIYIRAFHNIESLVLITADLQGDNKMINLNVYTIEAHVYLQSLESHSLQNITNFFFCIY